jgi:hypothetical protein
MIIQDIFIIRKSVDIVKNENNILIIVGEGGLYG